MANNQSQDVIIIGGGIVGLLAAQSLKKQNIKVTVYDAEPSESHYRPREWGMSVQWGLPLLSKCLPSDVLSRLHEANVDPNSGPLDPSHLPLVNAATGELVKNIPLVETVRVSRRRMRSLCATGINVVYDKKFTSLSYPTDDTVTVHFTDSSTATGTLVIGCDGANSPVRHAIFSSPTNQHDIADTSLVPYCALNTHVCYKDRDKALFVRAQHPIVTMGIHPAGYWLWQSIQDVPDPEKPETWVFQLQCTWRKPELGTFDGTSARTSTNTGSEINNLQARADREVGKESRFLETASTESEITDLSLYKRRAKIFAEPFRSAIEWIPEGTKLYANKMAYWHPIPWDTKSGRVLIAGDAAHPMTFQRGQGLNHGIADAARLGELIKMVESGEKGKEEMAKEYMDEMIERAGEEVKISKMNTEMLHDWGRMQESPLFQRGGDANKKEAPVANAPAVEQEEKKS